MTRDPRRIDGYNTGICKLDRIAKQINDHLTQSLFIRYCLAHASIYLSNKLNTLLRKWTHSRHAILNHPSHIERRRIYVHLPSFNLRQIQQVIWHAPLDCSQS